MENLQEKLKEYYLLAQKTHEITDNEALGKSDEFNDMIEIEEAILKAYGLPLGRPYQSIMENFGWEEEITERKISRVICDLKNSAVRYHHSAVESNEQILHWGKENYKPFDHVLPLMGFTPTIYNVFLYTELWLRKNYPIKEIIREMKQAQSFSNELNSIYSEKKRIAETAGLLKKAGAKYIGEFKAYQKNRYLPKQLIKDIDTGVSPLFGNDYIPEILETDKYYIESVYFFPKEDNDLNGPVNVTVYSIHCNMWQRYRIEMPVQQFQRLLLHCTQTELADLINTYAHDYRECPDFFELYTETVHLRKEEKTYLECNASIKAVLTMDMDYWSQYDLLSLGNS